MSIEALFLDFSVRKLEENMMGIENAAGKLSTGQVWMRGGPHQNAIGNLLLHLSGNVRQWIISSVGGEPDVRDRDAEFAATGGRDPKELLLLLRGTVDEAKRRIAALPHARLLDRMVIQGYDVSAMEAIAHVVEHFSGHAYQIFFITKMLTGEDLGFYAHLSKQPAAADQ
jgi:hypothetical protein